VGKSVSESNGLAEAVGWREGFEVISVKARLVGFADLPGAWAVQEVMSAKHSRMPDRKREYFMVFSSQEYQNYSARNSSLTPSKVALNNFV
jgi:hypothetical protein